MKLEERLTPQEISDRFELSHKIVTHVCSWTPWNQIITHVNLFGSLGQKEGKKSSDVDLAFYSTSSVIPTGSQYEWRLAILYSSINDCREIYGATFIINPLLVLDSWEGIDSTSHPLAGVLRAAHNGTRMWTG